MVLREVLHAHIPVLDAESTVREAVDKIDIYQFSGLVAVDDSRRPIGVVTEGDLARASATRDSFSKLADEPALMHGTRDPITASIDMEIGEALHEMLMRGITVLPIIEGDVLAGMVMRCDLMQAVLSDIAGSDPQ